MSKEEKDEFDPISVEEFLELVFRSTRGSVRKRAGRQAKRNHRTEKTPRKVKFVAWIMAIMLTFSTFAVMFEIYSIPALEFLKTSAKLSSQEDIQSYKKAVVPITTEDGKGTGFCISKIA